VFTRDGAFTLDRDGTLVTQQGLKLVPSVGAIPQGATPKDVTISPDGTVNVRVGDQYTQLGQIIATELINLILAQRAFEVNTKAITTSDQMLATANQLAR
jgi:flagellar basal-body rod protein FlgG